MKNTYHLLAFVCLMLFSVNVHAQFTPVAPSGNGTSGLPYQISSVGNLVWLAENPSAWGIGIYFEQTADIDLDGSNAINGGLGWKPIGNYTTSFQGRYDGGGHTISNMVIERLTEADSGHGAGLFGVVGATVQLDKRVGQLVTRNQTIYVKNLVMVNCTVKGLHATGVVVGRVFGLSGTSVENCKVENSYVEGTRTVGAIAGANNSEFGGTANVQDRPMIRACVAKNTTIVGVRGLVRGQAALRDNYPNQKFGSIAGCTQRGRIENSYALNCTIVLNDSINHGNVNYTNQFERIGGISGCLSEGAAIVNCYNNVVIDVTNCRSCSPNNNINNINFGPIAGFDVPDLNRTDSTDVLFNSYYNLDYYNTNSSIFSNNNGIGRTEAELRNRENYAQSWLFGDIWQIQSSVNGGFPYLAWENLGTNSANDLIWDGDETDNITDNTKWENGVAPNLTDGTARFSIAPNRKLSIKGDYVFHTIFIDRTAELIIEPGNSVTVNDKLDNLGRIVMQSNSPTDYAQLKFGEYDAGDSDSEGGLVEFSMHINGNGWHNLANPFVETYADSFSPGRISADFHPNARNFFGWNASDTGADAYNYSEVLNGGVLLEDGKGYIAYFGTNGILDDPSEEYQISFSGVPNTTVSPEIFFTEKSATSSSVSFVDGTGGEDGWNLVGNTFTCALDFSSLGINPANGVNNAFYIWNPSSNQYISWAGGSLPGESEIAPLQSFWIQTNTNLSSAAGTFPLAINTNGATPASPPAFLRPAESYDRLVLNIEETQNPSNNDKTIIAFIPETTDGYDPQWDAHKMKNGGEHPNMFSRDSLGHILAINAINFDANYAGVKSLPLSVEGFENGLSYTITLNQSYLNNQYYVYLEDLKENTLNDLTQREFSFEYDETMDNRFILHFQSLSLANQPIEEAIQGKNENILKAWVYSNTAYIQSLTSGNAVVEVLDIQGRVVQSENILLEEAESFELQIENKAAGMYLLRVNQGGNLRIVKFFASDK